VPASPTIVLVHGAFTESACWDGVLERLAEAGVPGIAAANPLRSVAADAASVSSLVRSLDGPVVLVGHSYGGAVITNVDSECGDVVAAVYVAAFAPEPGESCLQLASRYPGSKLGEALNPVPRADGQTDLYISLERFPRQQAADVPAAAAALMAATQRPIAQAALEEPSGDGPLWRRVPSFFVFGDADRNVPPAMLRAMAARAEARRIVEVPGGSHALPVSQPDLVAELVLEAAAVPATA
jgi:pimeloyl-ACP methyl ester carboxylesterase